MKIEALRELWLVRHAESVGNSERRFTGHGPSPLSDRGEGQALALAESIASTGFAFEAVYSSDLVRAMQTAAPVAMELGLAVRPFAALRERDLGDLMGLCFDEVRERFPEAWAALMKRDDNWAPPNGESHAQCAARVCAAIETVLSKHPRGRVIVVSHGVAIHHILRHFLGVTAPAVYFTVDNASVQRIEWHSSGTVRAACVNDTAHLR